MLENIKDTKVLMLDLDGTVYLDTDLIGDVKNTLKYFRNKGVKIVYLTNNSSRTDEMYEIRLKNMGIFEDGDMVYSSLDCAIDFINDNFPNQSVYAVANDKVFDVIKGSGLKITKGEADIVLLTFDSELTYQKIVHANELMVKGAKYIATHPDTTCPSKPVAIPDLGSIIQMFKSSSGREPDFITGKPYDIMAKYIIAKTGANKSQTTMVGDRLYTDIQFGINSGINTVLVLSGETTLKTYKNSSVTVDLVLNDVNELKKYI